ncbi:hypothetical protein [Streptomyces roseifaciens]|uniref:hypothetical protein n=1 Tax=Streptomyces roseifaciens TaxID=1488406 RepID=UPI000718159D|nr:hypothetical protein [Streptomyces roseifaciens]
MAAGTVVIFSPDPASVRAFEKPRPVRTVRWDGREPMSLGAAIGALVTERTVELPAADANTEAAGQPY